MTVDGSVITGPAPDYFRMPVKSILTWIADGGSVTVWLDRDHGEPVTLNCLPGEFSRVYGEAWDSVLSGEMEDYIGE